MKTRHAYGWARNEARGRSVFVLTISLRYIHILLCSFAGGESDAGGHAAVRTHTMAMGVA